MTWSKTEIEEARSRPLAPLLQEAGYELEELRNGAMLVAKFRGMVVRENLWFWKERNLKGNTIDFFMLIEARTFAETMALLCPPESGRAQPDVSKRKPRPVAKKPAQEDKPMF